MLKWFRAAGRLLLSIVRRPPEERRRKRVSVWDFVAALAGAAMVAGLFILAYALDAWWQLLPWHWQLPW